MWLPEKGKEYFIDVVDIGPYSATISIPEVMVDAFETYYPVLHSKLHHAIIHMGRDLPFVAKVVYTDDAFITREGFTATGVKNEVVKLFSVKIK